MTAAPSTAARVLVAYPIGDSLTAYETEIVEISTPLTIRFRVEKTTGKGANKAEITVVNLAPETRGRLQRGRARVELYAGLEGQELELLARGDAIEIVHRSTPPDALSVFRLADGARATAHAQSGTSFAAGSLLSAAIRATARDLGLDASGLERQLAGMRQRLPQGYVARGRAADDLTRLLGRAGYAWASLDGALDVFRPGEAREGTIPLITSEEIVGSPEFAPPSAGRPHILRLRVFLRPDLQPRGLFALESTEIRGTFRAAKITHEGDTSGGEWYTSIEATPI